MKLPKVSFWLHIFNIFGIIAIGYTEMAIKSFLWKHTINRQILNVKKRKKKQKRKREKKKSKKKYGIDARDESYSSSKKRIQ